MPSPKGYVPYLDRWFIFPDGRVWKKIHSTIRKDGVKRIWKSKFMPLRKRNTDIGKGGGYVYVDLEKTHLVHRLVALCFIPNPNGYKQVNHKNGVRWDNRVENLEWVSAKDNQRHAYHILKRKRKSKLTDKQKIEIYKLRNEEKLPLKEIANLYGVAFQTVSDIALGNRFILRKEDTHHA